MAGMMLQVLFLFTLTATAICQTIPFVKPEYCSSNEFFRISSLSCVTCGPNLNSTRSAFGCVCNNGYRLTTDFGGPDKRCTQCGPLEVTTLDGKSCIKCPSDSDYDVVTKTCKPCPDGSVTLDKSLTGGPLTKRICATCTGETQPSSTGATFCQRCDENVITVTSGLIAGVACQCPTGTQTSRTIVSGSRTVSVSKFGGVCFVTPPSTLVPNNPSIYTLKYDSLSFESNFFKENLISSQQLCKTYQNYTACQLLGNLCVMMDYDETNSANTRATQTDACREFLRIVQVFVGGFTLPDWPATMPWLFYKQRNPINILSSVDISQKFELGEKVTFIFAAYTANGSFVGWQNSSNVLRICEDRTTKSSAADMFGHTYKISCLLSVEDLWIRKETLFYDGFILVNDQDLYPIPVRVRNVIFQGGKVNDNSDQSQWRLTRRFFLVDNLSGRLQRESLATVVRYASSIELSFKLRTTDGQIYPPLLSIKYSSIPISQDQTRPDTTVPASFETKYEMNTDSITRNVQIATGVLSALSIFFALSRIISWRKRNGSFYVDCASLAYFLIYSMSALSVAFFAVVAGTCFQWLIFYKQQTTVYRLLPTSSQENLLKGLLISAFIFKVFDVAWVIYSQVFIDVFFIDWERPRGRTVSAAGNTPETGNHIPVSIMRTLFVANEWRELQIIRKIKPTFQIILVLLCLEVIGLKHLTTSDPLNRLTVNSNDDYIGDASFVLRFAVTSVLFLCIAIVQWLFFGFIYERFVADEVGDFVDFCSLSNVSVFVLNHKNFGYYIHGRSVHGRSDTDLRELYEQFKREEDNLCGQRGLEPNSDNQTFEMFLPQKFRLNFERIHEPLQSREQGLPKRGQYPGSGGVPSGGLSPAVERSVIAYNAMNRYLSTFLEHSIRDCDYVVRDKLFLEKVLDMELQTPMDRGFFYNDAGSSFTNLLLCGKEWTLLLFDVLLFGVVDLIFTNYVLSGIITYAFDQLIVLIRDTLGKKNIARKTLVDERFLL